MPESAALAPHGTHVATRDDALVAALDEARARTFRLVEGVPDDLLMSSPHPVLGPIAWDLAHVSVQWDIWLAQNLAGLAESRAGYNDRYDAYRHPRSARAALPLLDKAGARAYSDEVRARAVAVLAETPPAARTGPLWEDGYAHWMMVLHDAQHDETILQGMQCLPVGAFGVPGRRKRPEGPGSVADDWVRIPAGPFPMGIPKTSGTYDNEWPQHIVDVPAFDLARHPVTNADWLRFMAAGGYGDAKLWTPAGWAWARSERLTHPLHWHEIDGVWMRKEMERLVPLDTREPVCNISWYEADAYARFAGCRLPTEAEWEKAATWGPSLQKTRWPWGDAPPAEQHANLDHAAYAPAALGSHAAGRSAWGIEGLVGDTWEWTASDFLPYPGYTAFPYAEYSAIFFGDQYKVLRGGSFATRPLLRLGTFRNWDLPIRRQIFAGVRLARDPTPSPERTIPRPERTIQ